MTNIQIEMRKLKMIAITRFTNQIKLRQKCLRNQLREAQACATLSDTSCLVSRKPTALWPVCKGFQKLLCIWQHQVFQSIGLKFSVRDLSLLEWIGTYWNPLRPCHGFTKVKIYVFFLSQGFTVYCKRDYGSD